MSNVQKLGRYELLKQLAIGGMGRVWLARSLGTAGFERHVVIKTLDTHQDESFVTMFLDEARVLGRMHHQHIAPLFELDRAEDGSYFLVMEYVHGHNAQAVWDRAIEIEAALPLDFALTVAAAAASALHYAHTRTSRDGTALGVVHRDVSLANLMVGFDGAVKLIDFGIAKAVDRATMTQTGYIKGKLGCMAPEQVNGSALDHRTDIFALGVALYEMTTMTRAFRVASDLKTLERIRKGDFIAPSKVVPNYPRGLELIIMKALRTDREQRFQDADSMRREIEAFGHRQKLVMGDSAVVEVMSQLFENIEPWHESPELDAVAHAIPAEVSNNATVPVDSGHRTVVRNLRAATELADQMVIEVHSRPEEADLPIATADVADESKEPEGDPTAPIRQSSPVIAKPSGPPPPPARKSAPVVPAESPRPPPPLLPSNPAAGNWQNDSGTIVKPAVPGARMAVSEGDWRGESGTIVKPATATANATPSTTTTRRFSKRGAIESAIVLTMVAIIVGVIHLASSSAAPPRPPIANTTTPDIAPPAPPPVTPNVAARPAPHPPTVPAPPPPPAAPTEIHVKIVTNPADATVILDGNRLGHTPYEGKLPVATGTHVLKIRRRGYTSLKLDVDLDKDLDKTLTLQAAPDGS